MRFEVALELVVAHKPFGTVGLRAAIFFFNQMCLHVFGQVGGL